MRAPAVRPIGIPASFVREKTPVAHNLLKLGPLVYGEFREITGWQPDECEAVLAHMKKTRMAEWVNGRWRLRS
jgi:hypothetical protein